MFVKVRFAAIVAEYCVGSSFLAHCYFSWLRLKDNRLIVIIGFVHVPCVLYISYICFVIIEHLGFSRFLKISCV
jgi:hypothetical protein